MKSCGKCNKTKSEIEFAWKVKDEKRQSYCRDCQKQYRKAHYQANKDKYLAKARRWNLSYRNEIRQKLVEYIRTHPCVDCGETDYRVLEFDHISGEKEFNVSEWCYRCYPWEKIRLEIEKCAVRCANCHRKKTYDQFNWWKPASLV